MKKLYLFIFSFIFFSFGIFFIKSYFFGGIENELNTYIEDNYIEPTLLKTDEVNTSKEKYKNEKISIALKSAYNIKFSYIPNYFNKDIVEYVKPFNIFLNSYYFENKINNLKIELYKEKIGVRGKMKNHTIKLYGIKSMSIGEFISVGIHEYSHHIDLYFLEKKVFTDLSDYFYNISWESTKVIKGGLVQSDFVSGYAMTNKYEDFAETLTYFILHNNDFLNKTEKSKILKEKYDFISKYLFRGKEFIGTDFSIDNKIEVYYRDITKIDFSLKNFLVFFKK